MSSVEAIRNYVRLTPDIGTAGQPRRDQFESIAGAGFDTVINIAMPDHADSIDDEGGLVTRLKMNYLHLQVPFDAPEIDHLRQFCTLLEAQRGRQLFVHCIMNYRVSAFMYLYLKWIRGYSELQARSPIFEVWQVEPQWQALMELDAAALNFNPD